MTRYFYTDPLTAAWMVKHFGMTIALKLLPSAEDYEDWKENDDILFSHVDPIDSADGDDCLVERLLDTEGDYEQGKWYIHPDSLHLLEAQNGDIGEFQGEFDCVYDVISLVPYRGKMLAKPLNMVAPEHFCKRIIQRNGLAFIWPESEAA